MRGHQPSGALPDASRLRVAVVVSRFNARVTEGLREGAVAALREAGAPAAQIEEFAVPGAFEIPQAARALAESGRFDAIVCLGCLIQGETPHFTYIASATAHGIMTASLDTRVPMAFGVLTVNTEEQALERAGSDPGNKGREAAAAAIEMAALYRTLGYGPTMARRPV
jgi:6,7-dimethyl-8-ribityllumazine synthase